MLTPPEVAKLWGIKPHKVLAWIRSGELRAMNAAEQLGGRPRYLIDLADLQAFVKARQATADPPKPRRQIRKSKPSDFVEYF
ncbi:MAG: helix-turn-helix domain-containing protein [Nocardioidaceae bacterium]|nr:helix-turn-helix domain-containing protein [Nocardioidaceae bacterium]